MKRPWLRRLVIGIAALLLVAVGIFGWAAASVQRSAIARAMWWRDADIGDQFRFPSRAIPNGGEAGPLPSGTQLDLSSIETPDGGASGDVECPEAQSSRPCRPLLPRISGISPPWWTSFECGMDGLRRGLPEPVAAIACDVASELPEGPCVRRRSQPELSGRQITDRVDDQTLMIRPAS
jgi:hypothetical protein